MEQATIDIGLAITASDRSSDYRYDEVNKCNQTSDLLFMTMIGADACIVGYVAFVTTGMMSS
jgi:hypothetical protein